MYQTEKCGVNCLSVWSPSHLRSLKKADSRIPQHFDISSEQARSVDLIGWEEGLPVLSKYWPLRELGQRLAPHQWLPRAMDALLLSRALL